MAFRTNTVTRCPRSDPSALAGGDLSNFRQTNQLPLSQWAAVTHQRLIHESLWYLSSAVVLPTTIGSHLTNDHRPNGRQRPSMGVGDHWSSLAAVGPTIVDDRWANESLGVIGPMTPNDSLGQ